MKPDYSVTESDIYQVEMQFDVRFPEMLKIFLQKYNGAEIYLSEITINEVKYEIASLIPLKYGRLPVEKIMEWDRVDGFVSAGHIPVASDRGGNLFYVDSKSGAVLLFLSDDIENPKPICASFNDFIEQLKVLLTEQNERRRRDALKDMFLRGIYQDKDRLAQSEQNIDNRSNIYP